MPDTVLNASSDPLPGKYIEADPEPLNVPKAKATVAETFNDPEFRKTVMTGVLKMDNGNAQDAIRRFQAILEHTANG